MISAIEDAIVTRLRTALAPLPVEALSVRGQRFSHAKGGAVVLASDLSAGGVEDTGAAVQGAALTVSVVFYANTLRESAGVWALFDAARKSLLSFQPAAGASPLRLLDAQLDVGDGESWVLATRWQTLVPIAPDLDYDGGPILTRVTFEEV